MQNQITTGKNEEIEITGQKRKRHGRGQKEKIIKKIEPPNFRRQRTDVEKRPVTLIKIRLKFSKFKVKIKIKFPKVDKPNCYQKNHQKKNVKHKDKERLINKEWLRW